MTIKYIIHPEYMISKSDGESHYISFCDLLNAYQLNIKECVRYQEDIHRYDKNLIHLYPRYHGDYLEYLSEIQITK